MEVLIKEVYLVTNLNNANDGKLLAKPTKKTDHCLHLLIDSAIYVNQGKQTNFNGAKKIIEEFKDREFKVLISGVVIYETNEIKKVLVLALEFEPSLDPLNKPAFGESTIFVEVTPEL